MSKRKLPSLKKRVEAMELAHASLEEALSTQGEWLDSLEARLMQLESAGGGKFTKAIGKHVKPAALNPTQPKWMDN